MKFLLTKKWMIISAAVLVAIIILFFIVKKVKSAMVTNKLNDLEVDNNAATISNDQAILIAENLLNAMDRIGTDEQSIIDNLTGLNYDDLILIIKAFGTKPYYIYGLAYSTLSKAVATDYSLIGWLRAELKGDKLDQVKEIFESNGIPF